MKAKFKERPQYPAHVFMRTVGYAKYVNGEGIESYVRRVSGFDFPRFHVYIEDQAEHMTLSIHIDHKAHTYDGVKAHSGEYQGSLIEHELGRIHAALGVPMVLMVDKKGVPIDR